MVIVAAEQGLVVVAGIAFLLYLNSVPGDFVFDDHEAIESNRDVRSGNLEQAEKKWLLLCVLFITPLMWFIEE